MHQFTRQRLLLGLCALAVFGTGVGTAAAGPVTGSYVQQLPATYTVTDAGSPNVRNAYVPGRAVEKGGEVHGIVLTDAGQKFTENLKSLGRLARDGVNTVDLIVTEYQHDAHSNQIFDGPNTPTAAEVTHAARLAEHHGIAVEIMPLILCTPDRHSRFTYSPSRPRVWFRNYRQMIVRWAKVAQASHAYLFSVGSEYSSTVKYVKRWRTVIHAVRRVFDGKLTYMTTVGIGTLQHIRFWKQLDIISVSPYFSLSRKAVPTVHELVKAWRPIIRGEEGLATRFHRPFLWDELGYPSQLHSAYKPYVQRDEPPSQQAQANEYQAAIDVSHGYRWLRGVVFFRWGPAVSPATDGGYQPNGKKAECVMAESWGSKNARSVDGEPEACAVDGIVSGQ